MTKDSATTTGPPSTSTCFLGCFGCSGGKPQLTDEVNSSSRHRYRRRRWISKWRFSFKKPPTKTVPVDLPTVPEKSKPVTNAPTTPGSTWEENENPTLTKKHAITVDEEKPRRKKWTVAVKSQNGSNSSRKKETKPAARSAPDQKTVTMAHPLVSSPLKPLSHSKSQPPAKRQKHPHAPPVDEGLRRKSGPSGGEFDSIIGMSIILVILVILVLWGKLCAILCTSSWFFIAPRLVAAGQRSAVDSADKPPPESHNSLDLESVEYKKKVILEGLLQRNHRNIVGRL
ncbi:hypothetical protein L1987_17033 [Smallanthus sonchifolius]|uniref:Uncharacterized protein n=1 Tax=Smallanthus sonchifolius TaxID=185202 RepID=A0ACB9IXY8_9ASTR|nr:hypothetical protein L1987_17033 [Smallanthus sonchifolius]